MPWMSWIIHGFHGYPWMSMDIHVSMDSMDMHGFMMDIHGFHGFHGFFRKCKKPCYVVSLWNAIIIRKNENPGLTGKSRFLWEISSQINFSTENLISSYGHDEHFGRAFCPKPILKVWFWRKTFFYVNVRNWPNVDFSHNRGFAMWGWNSEM